MSGSDDERPAAGESGPVMSVVRTLVPDAIRRRFALKFVIVLLIMGVTIVGVGYLGTQAVASATEERIENEYRSLAVQEANLVEKQIDESTMSTRLASRGDVWTSDNATVIQEEVSETLTDMSTGGGSAAALMLYTVENGEYRVIADATGTDEPLGSSRERWVSDLSFEGPSDVRTSSVYSSRAGPVVGMVSPVEGADRFLLAEFSVNSLAARFQGSERADGGFTQVVNESGTVLIDEKEANRGIAFSDALSEYGDQKALSEARGLSNVSSAVSSDRPANDLMNESYVVGYATIRPEGVDENWYAMVHAPRGELFADARSISQTGLLVTGGLGLIIILIGAVLGFNTSRSIDRLTGKAEAMEEGDLDVAIASPRIDNIGRLYDGFANMRDALREQIEEAEQARKEAEVSRAEAMEMNEYLQEKAEDYSDIMQACARGDLTQRMTEDGENESMDQIAREFNEMITELEMTTGQLKTFASEVEQGGQSVQQSAETVRDASEQVADSIQKISDDAYDQKERLQRISEEMDDVAARLEQFADTHDVDVSGALESIREVAAVVDEAAELGEQAMTESESVAGAAEEQAAELNEVSNRAGELTRYAQYLGDGLGNFETEEEHEFVFQTGGGGPGAGSPEAEE